MPINDFEPGSFSTVDASQGNFEKNGKFKISKYFSEKPPQLDFIWSGLLAGTVGALVAPGGTGKSFFALEAAMSVACIGEGGDILGISPRKKGRVYYFASEDPVLVLHHRIHDIGKHFTQNEKSSISENLFVKPILGYRLNVANETTLKGLIADCVGARLIIFDTLSRIHNLDENSNSDMSALVSILESVANQTGAAVVYLHHANKSSAKDGYLDQQQAARGASALIDNARWCGYLAKMGEDEAKRLSDGENQGKPIGNERRELFVRFGVSKQNYENTPFFRWFYRSVGGVLVPVNLKPVAQKEINEKTRKRTVDGF